MSSLTCAIDSDCSEILYICLSNLCTHKSFFPLSFLDLLTLFLVFIGSIITTVAGVGGGLFFFPILLGISNFYPTPAVAISLSIVTMLMIVRFLMSYKERNAFADRPLINYDISVILCPSSIVGTIFGVFFNRTSPNWIVLILILVSMGISLKETWKKAQEQKEKENRESHNPEYVYIPLKTSGLLLEGLLEKRGENENLGMIHEEEKKNIPMKKFGILIINLAILIIILLLQGSKTTESLIGIPFCGTGYWIFIFIYIPFGIIILYFSVKMLNEEYQMKQASGYKFLKSDVEWNLENLKKSLILGFLIGFTSAILGVGGAIITGPVLLSLGFDAREATYTATFIAVFTSIAGSIQYLFAGIIYYDYAFFSLMVGLVGLWIGMEKLLDYVKRSKKPSIIMFTLAGCVAVAILFIVVPGIRKTMQDYQNETLFQMRDYC